MRFLAWWISNAVALLAATWLLDGIRFTDTASDGLVDRAVPLLGVALILGAFRAVVKPALTIVSLPLVLLTLGLFLLVINAAVLLLTGWLAQQVDPGLTGGFRVDGFWPAVGGAIVVTLVSWLVDRALDR